MSQKYKSDAMAAIHETMEALYDVGIIDKQTMRGFDDACRTPIRPLKPKEIRAIREKEHVSQTVFANSPQRHQQLGEQMGARRKTPLRRLPQTPVPSRKTRPSLRRVICCLVPSGERDFACQSLG